MTVRLSSRGGFISGIRTGVATLLLIAVIILAGCTGLKYSSAIVSQDSTNTQSVRPTNAHSAALAVLQGSVEVKSGNGQWTQAKSGQMLKSGQHIRTGVLSNAVLAFYDGSQIHLGTDSEITLDALNAPTSGARIVQLTQVSGESQQFVSKSDDPGSHYDINTPSGNGSTNDATFTLMVFPSQLSQFWVEAGDISVANENITVKAIAGQTTSALVGQPPIDPEFRISGEGQVMQIGTDGTDNSAILPVFSPNGQTNKNSKITLCHATGSTSNPYVEITVSVEGAINGHAQHPGDIIPAPTDGCPTSAPITSSTPTSWNIAGQTYRTGASIIVFGHPQPGDWVSFEGRQLVDGTRFIDRIALLDHSSKDQFTYFGKVESTSNKAWTVSSRVVQINELTTTDPGLKVGDNVQVVGGIAKNGDFAAASLSRTRGVGSNFHFAGILSNISKNTWVISGIKIAVDQSTTRYGDFVLGNPLEVEGVIQDDGRWLATTINLVTPGGYHFEYSGIVKSLSPWTISSVSFNTADWTEIDPNIKLGDKVRVGGTVNPDGIWVADRIDLLDMKHPTSFTFFGPVLSINPWNVGNFSLAIDGNTMIKSDISLGEMVKVTGWIMEDGTWLATDIKHTGLHLGQGCYLVSGVVQSVSRDQILLADGQTITRTDNLVVTGDLKAGSLVRYQFCVDDQGHGKIGSVTTVYQLEELPQSKAVICHRPPGNPGNQHTIEIGQPALAAHMAHGDTLGPCSNESLSKHSNQNK